MFLGFDEASSTAGVDVRVANFDGLTPVVVFEDSTFDFRGPLPADDGSLTLFQSGVQPLMSLRFALSLARPWLLPVALCPLSPCLEPWPLNGSVCLDLSRRERAGGRRGPPWHFRADLTADKATCAHAGNALADITPRAAGGTLANAIPHVQATR